MLRPLDAERFDASAPPGGAAGRVSRDSGLPRAPPPGAGAGGRVRAVCRRPSAGDVFFDLEGDPYVGDGGHRVPVGLVDRRVGLRVRMGARPDGEKAAFERFVDRVVELRAHHPGMHVFHYAPHELSKLRVAFGAVRDPRGRGRRPAARRSPGRPLRRRAAGPAGRRGELLAQEARAPPRLRAPGEAGARGRRLDRRLRNVARDRRRRNCSRRSAPTTRRTAARRCRCATGCSTRCARRPRPSSACDFDDYREPEPAGGPPGPRMDARRVWR